MAQSNDECRSFIHLANTALASDNYYSIETESSMSKFYDVRTSLLENFASEFSCVMPNLLVKFDKNVM